MSERPTSASASATQIRRADVLVDDEARPERDEQRREVLDQERDPDLEPVDRQEVEELDERDARDPEDGEEEQLAARRARGAPGGSRAG